MKFINQLFNIAFVTFLFASCDTDGPGYQEPYDPNTNNQLTETEMLDLVQFSSIFVLEKQADGTVPIGLRFFCNWSDEGLGLKLVNNEVVAVGNDYVALGVEDGWEGLKQ